MATPQVIQLAPPTIVQKGATSAKVVGILALSALINVVGDEIEGGKTAAKGSSDALTKIIEDPFLVIVGTTFLAVVLVLLADIGGDPGERAAMVIAVVILLFSALNGGAPLWAGLENTFTKKESAK